MAEYDLIAKQVQSFAEAEADYVPLLANVSALLWESLETINWAGFYLMDQGSLLLGPFQGRSACIRIAISKGVCGSAAGEDRVLRIDDVHTFPEHIACDAASRSEIVVPLHAGGRVIGVLDIDSPMTERFTPEDEAGLTKVAAVIEALGDFSRLRV